MTDRTTSRGWSGSSPAVRTRPIGARSTGALTATRSPRAGREACGPSDRVARPQMSGCTPGPAAVREPACSALDSDSVHVLALVIWCRTKVVLLIWCRTKVEAVFGRRTDHL